MAFMMPVMKNNYDIYKDTRSRKTSECSNASSNGVGGLAPAKGVQRKSESFSSTPSHCYRPPMQRCYSHRTFPRNGSKASSHTSVSAAMSPTRTFSHSNYSPKKAMANTMTAATTATANAAAATENANNENQNDFSKFHLRLVEKLRKSFRKDSVKRS